MMTMILVAVLAGCSKTAYLTFDLRDAIEQANNDAMCYYATQGMDWPPAVKSAESETIFIKMAHIRYAMYSIQKPKGDRPEPPRSQMSTHDGEWAEYYFDVAEWFRAQPH